MSKLIRFLMTLFPGIDTPSGQDRSYLAQAVDIYDLERRMVQIDDRASNRLSFLTPGFEGR
jgi:hypothetical protein